MTPRKWSPGPGELVMERGPWKLYRQDAGMGETEYVILRFDTFFALVDDESTAGLIMSGVDRVGKNRTYIDEALNEGDGVYRP